MAPAHSPRAPTDKRGPWVDVTRLRSWGPGALARAYRQHWRVEQAIEERRNGPDLDYLVTYELPQSRRDRLPAARPQPRHRPPDQAGRRPP